MRTAFFSAYDPSVCEYVPLAGAECDRRLREGPEMVSANFVIPYPPGFPIMVPGQVLTQETIDFMRKLDVKEIHGYEKAKGLKLVKPDAVAAKAKRWTKRGSYRQAARESRVVRVLDAFLVKHAVLGVFLIVFGWPSAMVPVRQPSARDGS